MEKAQIVENLNSQKKELYNEISKVIIGQEQIINQIFTALICRGHILLEGVPGLAKTLLIKTISDVLQLSFNRIQFTPDLMPSDITGTDVIDTNNSDGKRELRFIKGPIFSNIILADEINRTPPKTQSALLEAMQENKVTTGGTTYNLDRPFFVLATQNPIEQEGTYPLPEAQLDRFMFKIKIEYPSQNEEINIVKSTTGQITQKLNQIISKDDLIKFQNIVRDIPVSENVVEYAVNLVRSTRPNNENSPQFIKEWLDWGAGPRASSFLILGAKAVAALDGRTTPSIADVQNIVKPILRHRIITNFNAEAENISTDNVLEKLIDTLPVN
tara:strand:+ start:248 stop:1234 length:987 start_codon:yes stop_codon:yes gene_type:complete